MMTHERIERNPSIMFGKPVIKGTRITVELILRKLAAGQPVDQILAAHPHLKVEDVYAAAAFAAGEETKKLLRLRELLAESAETFAGTFIVVEPNNMRIRPLF